MTLLQSVALVLQQIIQQNGSMHTCGLSKHCSRLELISTFEIVYGSKQLS